MNQRSTSGAVSGLRWVLGLVILLESVHFAVAPAAAREVAKIGLPPWIPLALGGTEALAALMFLARGGSVDWRLCVAFHPRDRCRRSYASRPI